MAERTEKRERPAASRGRPRRRRGPVQRMRRRLRRTFRRHPAARIAAVSLCLLTALGLGAWGILSALPRPDDRARPEAEIAAPPVTHAPTPVPTATPQPTPDLSAWLQTAAPGPEYADPARNELLTEIEVFDENPFASQTGAPIHMPGSDGYTALEGVTTFRGSHYRDGGAWGTIPENPSKLTEVWQKGIHKLDDWSGVGWTGQCSLVRWPEETRRQMNIDPEKKAQEGLVEVIYATLDGHIYFLDMADGTKTREAIDIDAPIKGSLTVDPRGLPLLYCGQGIYEVNGKRVKCGTRIWSLIDQELLYFLDGKDPAAHRGWFAFDCAPLVDGASDTMITAGENGVLYRVKLNTRSGDGGIGIDPSVTRYVYRYDRDSGGKLGTENSVAIYNSYVYFATNNGTIQCVDLNDMSLIWSFAAQDDIDASLVIEVEDDGTVALYAANELDRRGHSGVSQMFKLNALTGELLWSRDTDPLRHRDDNGGGSFATPAVGKNDLSGLVYFHICRTRQDNGRLYALDKATGETVWTASLDAHGWSSPTCLYTPSGKGYVLVGSSDGMLRLLDGLSGQEVASIELRGNIEGTPAVFDDMIVVGTRSCKIYGVRVE